MAKRRYDIIIAKRNQYLTYKNKQGILLSKTNPSNLPE